MGVTWETEQGPTSTAPPAAAADEPAARKGRRGRRARKEKRAEAAAPVEAVESTSPAEEDWSIPLDWLGPDRAAHLEREAAAKEAPPDAGPAVQPPAPPAEAVPTSLEVVDPPPPRDERPAALPNRHAAPVPSAVPTPPTGPATPPAAGNDARAAVPPPVAERPGPPPVPERSEPPSVRERPGTPPASERPERPSVRERPGTQPMPERPGTQPVPERPGPAPTVHSGADARPERPAPTVFSPTPGFEAQPLVDDEERGLASLADTAIEWARAIPPRRVALAVAAVVVLIGAFVATRILGSGPIDASTEAAPTPLGMGTMEVPTGCVEAPVAEEGEVRVAALECPLSGGASLAVIEMDFRQAQADRLETRFLADSVLAARRDGWPGASIDTFTEAAPPTGWQGTADAAAFTGRVTVGGAPTQTVGRLVIADNQALLIVARADDRSRVEALVDAAAGSLTNSAGGEAAG